MSTVDDLYMDEYIREQQALTRQAQDIERDRLLAQPVSVREFRETTSALMDAINQLRAAITQQADELYDIKKGAPE